MNHTCEQCGKAFDLAESDIELAGRLRVDPPPLCMRCGMQRVALMRNERTLYKRNCDRCGKPKISLYHSDSPYVVYCHDCWWSDAWEAGSYALQYHAQKPFFEQFKALQQKVPRESLIIVNSKNSDFGSNIRDSKDCYFSFQVANSENIVHSWWVVACKDSFNCNKILNCELVESCIDCFKCSRSSFLDDCQDSSDCFFSYDLRGCTNCIFCSNLRNTSYCIGNEQLTKEEYARRAKEILNGSYATYVQNRKRFAELKKNAIHRFASIHRSTHTTGNYAEECKNCTMVFDAVHDEDLKNVALVLNTRNSIYCYALGPNPTEFNLGTSVIKGGNQITNSFNLFNSSDCNYCDSLISCSHCIGCVGLKKKEYCILNTQYSKEDYLKLKQELEAKGEIAKFIPAAFSTFAYNETAAHDKFPLRKAEALAKGFGWRDEAPLTTGQETTTSEHIPDTIHDINESILNEVLSCNLCSRNYRIIDRELLFYTQFHIPLPRTCPQCRLEWSRQERLPFELWRRRCSCERRHEHHSGPGGSCMNEFETSYAPERSEAVYCKTCYNAEVA